MLAIYVQFECCGMSGVPYPSFDCVPAYNGSGCLKRVKDVLFTETTIIAALAILLAIQMVDITLNVSLVGDTSPSCIKA